MAADAGISKTAAKKALESLMEVYQELKKGGRVSLVGFGSWSVSKRQHVMEEILKLVRQLNCR